jgi:hypothetical protein
MEANTVIQMGQEHIRSRTRRARGDGGNIQTRYSREAIARAGKHSGTSKSTAGRERDLEAKSRVGRRWGGCGGRERCEDMMSENGYGLVVMGVYYV